MGKDNRGGGFRGNARGRGGDRNSRGGDRNSRGGGGRSFGNKGGFRKPGLGARKKVMVEPFKDFKNVFFMRGDSDMILTLSMFPGESVYGEKRVTVEENNEKIEYRGWNPYRSKIGAFLIAGGVSLDFQSGSKVLYLGAASGTTCSHVSDIIGQSGLLYAVEFSNRCGRDLINMAKKRNNVVPIIDDARKPQNYRFIVNMVDFVFADVAQPDQSRIIAMNCKQYLKNGGSFMIALKASCIDSLKKPEDVFREEIEKLKGFGLTPKKKINLDPYQKDHCVITGYYNVN